MLYEYIITAFKVVVGVITNNRLVMAALIAIAFMIIWVVFSLLFSFQRRFANGARRINEYVSRNGMGADAFGGLMSLALKMPSEFVRGFNAYSRNKQSLPSEHIKRFESLDVELSGGVFKQNRSILKSYINMVFIGLLIFSLAILSTEQALTGYMVAEAMVIPLIFMLISKIIYYVYTAVRQYQYRSAVDEFNDMLENLDKFAADAFASAPVQNKTYVEDVSTFKPAEEVVPVAPLKQEEVYQKEPEEAFEKEVVTEPLISEPEQINEPEVITETEDLVEEDTSSHVVQEMKSPVVNDEQESEQELEQLIDEVLQEDFEPKEAQVKTETAPSVNHSEVKNQNVASKFTDGFTPNFSSLFEGDEKEQKRGRGRPKKEPTLVGEFVIRNDKEFEQALIRAEKLMQKNEEPLSASQTKRIEKQIKELVDAMTKYKEEK